jgi:hypothetical protein
MIIYSKSSGLAPASIGKLETPIKMVIEHESDMLTKKGGVCDWLFNIERSVRFGETIISQNEFHVFNAAKEGMDSLMNQINHIITMAANGEDPETCGTGEISCGGNCSSCSGCH